MLETTVLPLEIIGAVGIHNVCLLTNNPDKVRQLVSNGTNVSERMPLIEGSPTRIGSTSQLKWTKWVMTYLKKSLVTKQMGP